MLCSKYVNVMRAVHVLLTVCLWRSEAAVSVIPDDSVFWAAYEHQIYFTNDTVRWTSKSGIVHDPLPKRISLTNAGPVVGMAYDYNSSLLVTNDPSLKQIVAVDLITKQAVPIHIGTSKDVGQMTIDWRARNIYWTDGGYGWIVMQSLPRDITTVDSTNTNFKMIVDKYLDKPTGIIVHPYKYFLFWADAGDSPKIERSNLVGQDRTVITWHGLITPVTLCIDFKTDRLYWTDQSRGTIEYSDFDGGDRTIFVSDPAVDFYGITVFQNSVIFTAPNHNLTGVYSLQEQTLGMAVNIVSVDIPFYYVDVYDKETQPRAVIEGCDSVHIGCDQICVHMKSDRGGSCFCEDGYMLDGDGRSCTTEHKILERHILFTNTTTICAISVNVMNVLSGSEILDIECDVVSHSKNITRFAVDMANAKIFYTDGQTIYKQTAHGVDTEDIHTANGTITDMDYDWKTKELFWIETGDGKLYYANVGQYDGEYSTKLLSDTQINNVAVDPHNRNIYWISESTTDGTHKLNVWNRDRNVIEEIKTVLLSLPTDLEYDRISDRLLWNDDKGFIGSIHTDGTRENKVYTYTQTTGAARHAISAFKKFIIATAEEHSQIDVIYERDHTYTGIDIYNTVQIPILDIHVFDSTLQPTDLEPCEKDNGGCEHICLPSDERTCACRLGYTLDENKATCSSSFQSGDEFFLVLDIQDPQHHSIYQVSVDTGDIFSVDIDQSNVPSSVTFDAEENNVIWVDQKSRIVKKKNLWQTSETAVGTSVMEDSHIAVDVTGGNIYVTSGSKIMLFDPNENVKTILDGSTIKGTLGKIAVMPIEGLMVWVETGSTVRIVLANMDGSNLKEIAGNIEEPNDLAFDFDDGKSFYWCDSKLAKIERVSTTSLARSVIYENQEHKPVALDVLGEYVYFIPKNQRKIFRLDKDGGNSPVVVMEYPLFGTLVNLFVSKPVPEEHELCGNCNGGCSTICLPKGRGKTCACADDIALKENGYSCQHAGECDNIGTAEGLYEITDCCPELPNAECRATCKSGYAANSGIVCRNGKWNVSATELCSKKEEELPMLMYYAIGGGCGGAILILIIVVIVIVTRRRGIRKKRRRSPSLPSISQINAVDGSAESTRNSRNHEYNDPNGALGIDRPTPMEKKDEETYDIIDDARLHVNLPPLKDKLSNTNEVRRVSVSSERSERYGMFPGGDNYGYLTPIHHGMVPLPDYPIEDRKYAEFNTRNSGGVHWLTDNGRRNDVDYNGVGNGAHSSTVPRGSEGIPRREKDDGYMKSQSVPSDSDHLRNQLVSNGFSRSGLQERPNVYPRSGGDFPMTHLGGLRGSSSGFDSFSTG